MAAIEVQHLSKAYPGVKAVDDVSFTVEEGEIFGMVGPNGAGKTTTIECIEGLRKPDGGAVKVLGLDPIREGYELKERIGIQLQGAAIYDRIRVHEVLKLYASFYRHSSSHSFEGILEQLGLADRVNSYYANLSSGQKQRLHIALALVHDPQILFLDELTTGLDPQARRAMWDLIKSIRAQGKTIFLTTHYMEEAENLCDRVAIIDHGKIIALDTPAKLIAGLGAESRIVFSLVGKLDVGLLQAITGVSRVEHIGESVIIYSYSNKSDVVLTELIKLAQKNGWALRDLHVKQANLEDVFLNLTGREMRE